MKIENVILPGKEEFDFREYRYIYIQSGNGKITKDNFVNIVASANSPLIPKTGGVLSENFIIITPDNKHFYGLSYSKDLIGWREQIEKGATILNLNIGEIKEGKYFSILNGEKYKLEDCQFERYNFYDETGNLIKLNTPIEKEKYYKKPDCYRQSDFFIPLRKSYNFDIKDNENYYVTEDGILVHNGYAFNEDGSLKTINQSLDGATHPVTGVPYKTSEIIVDGQKVNGVFPVFDSKFTTKLPDDLLVASDPSQFTHCTKKLAEEITNNPAMASKFTDQQLSDIMNHKPRPEGLTWHHNEQTGVMELVDRSIHSKTGHTGGNSIWGEGKR